MTALRMIYITSLMIFTSALWHKTAAQQIVYPDSILMIKDPVTQQVGFIFPLKAAIDYRNLLADRVPQYQKTIAVQDSQLSVCNRLVDTKNKEIGELNGIIKEEREKYNKLDTLNQAYKKELKCKKFWQRASYVLFGSTAILTTILIAK